MQSPHPDGENLPEKRGAGKGGQSSGLKTIGKTVVFEQEVATNLALALSYAPLPPISLAAAVLVLIGQSDNPKFAKFHAIQSLILAVGILVANGVITTVSGIVQIVPVLGQIVGLLLWVGLIILNFAYFAYSVRLAYHAFQGKDAKVPLISQYAEIWADPK